MSYFPAYYDPRLMGGAGMMDPRQGGVCTCAFAHGNENMDPRMGGGFYVPVEPQMYLDGGASPAQKAAARRNIKKAHAKERKYGPTRKQVSAAKKNIKKARRRDGGADDEPIVKAKKKVVKRVAGAAAGEEKVGGQSRKKMLRTLTKARKMKKIIARAHKMPGGKGRIANRPAAKKLHLKETTRRN